MHERIFPKIYSVTQLNRHIRQWLEYDVGEVIVEGEISNLSKPSSGHFYFTLKDETAQLRCVYFRNRHNVGEAVNVVNGQKVQARGKLGLYEARGDYQLIIEQLNEAGIGDLHQQFEILKAKLAKLGLFEANRKKKIPRFPSCIGVITSATGAALRDILTTLARRFPFAAVRVYASDVQGKLASNQLIQAIQKANHDQCCDVIILARGGGSIEDLWAFNDEKLALEMVQSCIPVVTGIGHETDFTIADFVADYRAATPTAAAEAVTPDRLDLLVLLESLHTRLLTGMMRYIQHRKLVLNHARHKIASPKQIIVSHWQTLDYLNKHLHRLIRQYISLQRHQLHQLETQLQINNPAVRVQQAKSNLCRLEMNLLQSMQINVNHLKQNLIAKMAMLHAVSPLRTLDRGYALVTQEQKLVTSCHHIHPGDRLHVKLAEGGFNCIVETLIE